MIQLFGGAYVLAKWRPKTKVWTTRKQVNIGCNFKKEKLDVTYKEQ